MTFSLVGDIGLAGAGAAACGGGDDRCAEATFVAGLKLAPFPPMLELPEYPPPAADDPTGLPRVAAAAGAVDVPVAAAPPLALFSNAAARAEALGPLEAPMIAAALPVAELVLGAGAVEDDTGRWYRDAAGAAETTVLGAEEDAAEAEAVAPPPLPLLEADPVLRR